MPPSGMNGIDIPGNPEPPVNGIDIPGNPEPPVNGIDIPGLAPGWMPPHSFQSAIQSSPPDGSDPTSVPRSPVKAAIR